MSDKILSTLNKRPLMRLVIGALVIGIGLASVVMLSATATSSNPNSNQPWAAPMAGTEYFVIYNNSTGHIDQLMYVSTASVQANLAQNGITCPQTSTLAVCVNSYPIWDALGGNANGNPVGVGNAHALDVTDSQFLGQLLNSACPCTHPTLGSNFHVDLTTHQLVTGPPS